MLWIYHDKCEIPLLIHNPNFIVPLSETIKLNDPEGMLVPGTRQYNLIRQTWLEFHGTAETLEMVARNNAKFLKK